MKHSSKCRGKFALLLCLAAVCVLFSGCGQKYELNDGVYAQTNPSGDIKAAVSMQISENTFHIGIITKEASFVESGLSGTFEIKGDTITAVTDSANLTFIFKIVGDNTIRFVQEGSDSWAAASGDEGTELVDGAEFTLAG